MLRRFIFAPFAGLVVAASVGLFAAQARAVGAATQPAWLQPGEATIARVDAAPWLTPDEPEAALTQSAASAARDYGKGIARPGDVVYEPIGVRVYVLRVLAAGRTALVHGIGSHWEAYASLDRLVPEIPRGTALRVAGGFGGYADFNGRLVSSPAPPLAIKSGSRLTALEMGVAPFDTVDSDFVRVRVRVLSGALRGRTGWIAVAYAGLPLSYVPAGADIVAGSCRCRPIRFESPSHEGAVLINRKRPHR